MIKKSRDDSILVSIDLDLQDIIPGYLANRHKDVQLMREALSVSDFETVRVTGHSMKGSGGGYGFDAITDYGGHLENAAKMSDAAGILETLESLEGYLERVEIVYEHDETSFGN